MSEEPVPVSDLLRAVKSREVQRALLAEMRADRHFLAAAHLELVLAADYQQASDSEMAARSRLGAASCFWRAGQHDQAERVFAQLAQSDPTQSAAIQQVRAELVRDYPALAS